MHARHASFDLDEPDYSALSDSAPSVENTTPSLYEVMFPNGVLVEEAGGGDVPPSTPLSLPVLNTELY